MAGKKIYNEPFMSFPHSLIVMGCNEKENFSFSFFLSFSFLGEKWRTRNEKLGFINKEFEIVVSMVSNYYL